MDDDGRDFSMGHAMGDVISKGRERAWIAGQNDDHGIGTVTPGVRRHRRVVRRMGWIVRG